MHKQESMQVNQSNTAILLCDPGFSKMLNAYNGRL